MGVKTYTQELESSVAAHRMFKAVCSDSHNFMPKAFPNHIKSVEFVQGDCLAIGSVKIIKYVTPDGVSKFAKHRMDELDAEKFYYKYTCIEGGMLEQDIENVVVEVKFEPKSAGCVLKISSHFQVKSEGELDEGKLKIGKEQMIKTFKGVEEYLKANPELYA